MKLKFVIFLIFVSSISSSAQWTTNWKTLNTGTTKNINAMYFHTPDTGYIVGEDYLFKKTTDGGHTWEDLTAPATGERPGNNGNIIGIDYHSSFSFSHLDSGLYLTWEKGYHGVVTGNDGVTYTKFDYPDSNLFCSINGFKALPENRGNGYVNLYTFGTSCVGNAIYSNFYDGPFSVAYSDSVAITAFSSFTDVDRDSNITIMSSTDGYVWRIPWVNGKPDSVIVDGNYDITSIAYAGNQTWYASSSSGRDNMFISIDSGKSFVQDTTFEPSFSYPIINDMSFLSPESGIAVATSNGTRGEIIMRGNWDPWTKWLSVKADYPLKAVNLFGDSVAYVAGENGLMMKTGGKVDSTNSVIESEEQTITIYPNPTSTSFKIVGLEQAQLAQVDIVDNQGRTVLEFKTNKNQYDISELPKGLYWINVSTVNNHFVKQIVIVD
ncbi:MAG: T9SS type A sorting domain-containing protein [Salibacteraceae bacterium]